MINLGNLSIDAMEKRSGVEFPSELKEFMTSRQQDKASEIASGKWHCFDLPFFLVCGDLETAEFIYARLAPLTGLFKEPMQIGVQS